MTHGFFIGDRREAGSPEALTLAAGPIGIGAVSTRSALVG
jgi:hypothetical protein